MIPPLPPVLVRSVAEISRYALDCKPRPSPRATSSYATPPAGAVPDARPAETDHVPASLPVKRWPTPSVNVSVSSSVICGGRTWR